ncbi:hypothetical protein L204_101587 [Cryptococcus depauperatus]
MSAPSGIKVPDALTSAFSAALANADNMRALVFIIENESFKHLASVEPKGSFTDDISLLPPTLPSQRTPASFAYRLDSKAAGKWEWMMVTFVPDNANVRAKMLQASSRSGLMKALGANNFKHDWFATTVADLTPTALTAHLNHLSSPPPLSASEAALAEVREAEAIEAKRAALDPETQARRQRAVVGLSGKIKMAENVIEALKTVAQRSGDGWIVVLEIPSNDISSIVLLKSETCAPSQLTSQLPPSSPCYVFYSYPTPPSNDNGLQSLPTAHAAPRNTFQGSQGGVRVVTASSAPVLEGETESDEKVEEPESLQVPVGHVQEAKDEAPSKGRVIFIYSCPSKSPVKFRMIYSTNVRGVQQDAADRAGLEITAKLETSDPSELTASHLESSLSSSKSTRSTSLPTSTSSTFSKPLFGAPTMFGQPRPVPVRSATQVPLPPSEPSTPSVEDHKVEGNSKENIRKAFDAFGPRVGAGGGGGFARPRPAGRR